ncbi:hypothetical protein MP638_001455 [Amoeboaphelidium occidentale]|nr:hypothetical protein MP638_001455 [Amoeboaphelidium occidentale]
MFRLASRSTQLAINSTMKPFQTQLRLFRPSTIKSSATTSPSAAEAAKNPVHGSYHWQFERYLSVALVPLCTVPLFTGPSRTVDFLLTFALPIHLHLGFGQIITDYLNPRKIGSFGNKAVVGSLYLATALTIYGLFRFNTNDVGITEFVANLWNAKKQNQKESK